MNEELKPCPFCGGEATMKMFSRFKTWFYCRCKNCEISQSATMYEWACDAAEAWNRRTTE